MVALNMQPRGGAMEMRGAMVRRPDHESEILVSQLYAEHVPHLFNYGMNACDDQALVKNCIVELFLLVSGRPDLAQERGFITSTLFKIFRRLLIQELATSRGRSISFIHENLFSAETQMAEGLTSLQREALFLKFQRRLPYREVANVMDITIEQLRSQISKAADILLHRNEAKTNKASLMSFTQTFETRSREVNSYKTDQRIQIAVDCIILGFDGEQLKVLLAKKELSPANNNWSAIGGFIQSKETSEDAAGRLLYQVTTKTNVYIEQLHTFSALDRNPPERVISIVYFSLINIANYSEQVQLAYEVKWFSLNNLPPLILDHKDMILKAYDRLREKVVTHALGFELLPKKFTISQLKCLFEAIYGGPLDRRNFIKKMDSLGILKRLNEKETTSSRKGAFYYVFNNSKYVPFERAAAKP